MKKLVVVVSAVALSFAAYGIGIVGRMLDQGQRSAVMLQGLINAKFDGAHSPIDQVWLEVAPIEKLVGFYRMGFSFPVLKFNRQI